MVKNLQVFPHLKCFYNFLRDVTPKFVKYLLSVSAELTGSKENDIFYSTEKQMPLDVSLTPVLTTNTDLSYLF